MTVHTPVRSRSGTRTHLSNTTTDEIEVYGDVALHGCQRTLCGLQAGAPYLETTAAASCPVCTGHTADQGDQS